MEYYELYMDAAKLVSHQLEQERGFYEDKIKVLEERIDTLQRCLGKALAENLTANDLVEWIELQNIIKDES